MRLCVLCFISVVIQVCVFICVCKFYRHSSECRVKGSFLYCAGKRDQNKLSCIEKKRRRNLKSKLPTVNGKLVMTAKRISDQSVAECNKCKGRGHHRWITHTHVSSHFVSMGFKNLLMYLLNIVIFVSCKKMRQGFTPAPSSTSSFYIRQLETDDPFHVTWRTHTHI